MARPVREGRDHRVRAVGIGRWEPAAMRGANLEAREAVERPFKDQMRQGNRGFERVADRVRQKTIPGQPAARFQFAGERVHEDERPKLFALGPERVEFRVGEILAGDAADHADATEAERLDRVLDLCGGEVGILQGRGRKGDEPLRLRHRTRPGPRSGPGSVRRRHRARPDTSRD